MRAFIVGGPVSITEYLKKNYLRSNGERWGLTDDSTSDELRQFLDDSALILWDYPVEETDHIIENGNPIVLVKCADGYRWFECEECAI